MNKVLLFVVACIALGAVSNAAGNCITFRAVNPNGVANDGAWKPLPTQGRKPGDVSNSCDSMTRPRATQDAARLIHTFPDGTKLYASTRNGDIHKYSAVDQRGRELKVMLVQNSLEGMVPGPGDASERGKQRTDQQREKWNALVEEAIARGASSKKGCVVKVMPYDGSILSWDLAGSGMGCPKG